MTYDVVDLLHALKRFWWLVLLPPILVGTLLSVRNLAAQYQSSFSATVLIPGDTEVPGSSERPELMILDDIGPVVRSDAFANQVATQAGYDEADITGHLDASRYSRVVTVTAYADTPAEASDMARAAVTVLPGAVNAYMVADGSAQATVQIIDQPSDPRRGDENAWTITIIAVFVAVGIGGFLALVLDALLTTLRARPVADAPLPSTR